ncbi:ATP-dependent DNA helicase RecQ [Jatrophihabitans endophyticus]|uniref:DNA 3'-5' helicase n=1 Tax=Jatrophihabitans endophyticus TaxID=1206085 RepID=A0A1M5P8S4_9ACTN|nr:DEAD/DEAH box helicase [Jatrophihabitans endophyticus]SHG98190.1 ATP-dependent DNA helicase RecQ [Jatrophihabitans endophyticus]
MTATVDLRSAAQEHLVRLAGPSAHLRDDQWRAIEALVARRRKAVVIQRTGWGKSAVYWIAAGLRRAQGFGPTLVISPLLALMRDQVAAAERSGLRAVTLNSANIDDWPAIEAQIAADEVDVLLISPERLNSFGFRQRVLPHLAARIGMLVVDEAHCVSDWGSDFRADYRRIRDVLAGLPEGTPVLATTATANDRVTADVAAQLGTDTLTLRGSLDRESLALSVIDTPDVATAYAWIADALTGDDLPGSGLIYTLTVAGTTQLADFLRDRGHAVAPYSSATPPEERAEIERRLLAHELRAVVATSSLGMGLDHPTLGFVVNLGAPASPISYYQQVGRAGRALDVAQAVLLPTAADTRIWAYFDSTAFPAEDRVRRVLDVVADGPTTLPRIEADSGLRRGRLETLLKVLDVEGAVERADGGWVATGREWRYDGERYAGIAAARKREQAAMLAYERADTCLMQQLRHELDDTTGSDCGRCAVCTGRLPAPGTSPSPETVRAAVTHLRSQTTVLEPRKMWPSGLPRDGSGAPARRGKITESARAEAGRALAVAEDPAWSGAVAAAFAADEPMSQELFDGLVATLSRWGWPAGRPTWVTWVPSRTRPALLADAARRLAELGRMAVATPLRADGPGSQRDAATNVDSAAGALARLSVDGEVPPGPVLLLDDTTRSGFTFTVAAALLREHGAGPVYPLALHKTF